MKKLRENAKQFTLVNRSVGRPVNGGEWLLYFSIRVVCVCVCGERDKGVDLKITKTSFVHTRTCCKLILVILSVLLHLLKKIQEKHTRTHRFVPGDRLTRKQRRQVMSSVFFPCKLDILFN